MSLAMAWLTFALSRVTIVEDLSGATAFAQPWPPLCGRVLSVCRIAVRALGIGRGNACKRLWQECAAETCAPGQ